MKVKIEMAKFLQETLEQMAVVNTDNTKLDLAKKFSETFRKARVTGEPLSIEEIVDVSRRLSDTITLENIPRPQLVGICRFLSINAFGTDNFLRYQIRNRMQKLRLDDEMIDQENVDSLTLDELRAACHSRGIRIIGVAEAKLKRELKQWLHLNLKTEIPSVMLILARAFIIQDPGLEPQEALQSAIMSLPEHVVPTSLLSVCCSFVNSFG